MALNTIQTKDMHDHRSLHDCASVQLTSKCAICELPICGDCIRFVDCYSDGGPCPIALKKGEPSRPWSFQCQICTSCIQELGYTPAELPGLDPNSSYCSCPSLGCFPIGECNKCSDMICTSCTRYTQSIWDGGEKVVILKKLRPRGVLLYLVCNDCAHDLGYSSD